MEKISFKVQNLCCLESHLEILVVLGCQHHLVNLWLLVVQVRQQIQTDRGSQVNQASQLIQGAQESLAIP